MSTHSLLVCPRDGLFCKDGRGWQTSENGRGHALSWPHPSTVLGSLRAAYGRTREAAEGRTWSREAWPAKTAGVRLDAVLTLARPLDQPWSTAHRRWPTPHDAVYRRDEAVTSTVVQRLVPEPGAVPTLGRDDDPAREALWWPQASDRGKPQPRPQWWPEQAFIAWLCGEPLATAPAVADPPVRSEMHLQIDPSSQAALQSRLFSREIVETITKDADDRVLEWALATKVELPEGPIASPVRLGGDRRLCAVEAAEAELFEMPRGLGDAFERARDRLLRLVTVTPAAFEGGWVPDFLQRDGEAYRGELLGVPVQLRAALVPRPVDVAGWDMAHNRPKPLTRMVAPGSVYVLERTDGGTVDRALAQRLWLAAIGQRREEGFGLVVPGVWPLCAVERGAS